MVFSTWVRGLAPGFETRNLSQCQTRSPSHSNIHLSDNTQHSQLLTTSTTSSRNKKIEHRQPTPISAHTTQPHPKNDKVGHYSTTRPPAGFRNRPNTQSVQKTHPPTDLTTRTPRNATHPRAHIRLHPPSELRQPLRSQSAPATIPIIHTHALGRIKPRLARRLSLRYIHILSEVVRVWIRI